jgi:serine/threonine protein kinase
VAIKLVRAGQDSAFGAGRFRTERQILANLDHPNIARLLDGGATQEGVPYLVMELVEGVPIEVYCDGHRLTTTEYLKLFLQRCRASGPVIAMPTSIKGTGGESSGCAWKVIELTLGDLQHVLLSFGRTRY